MRKKIFLYQILLLSIFSAEAQHLTTLEECLQIGLLQNYDILLVKNEQQVASNNATRANAGMLPTLDLLGGYSGSRLNTSTTSESTSVTENYYGSYDQGLTASVGLGWTVFNGLKFRTNYKILKEKKILSELQTRLTIEDFISEFTALYYNYVQQAIRLKNYKYAVKLSSERLRIVEERFKIGNFSKLDLLQAQVDFNADSSQYTSQQVLVESSIIHLNELMASQDLTHPVMIVDSVIDVNQNLNFDSLKMQLLQTNASLLKSQHGKLISELDLKAVSSRNYPYVTLSASYGYANNLYGNSSTRLKSTLGPSAQVKLGYVIFDGNRRREQKNARIAVENAQIEYDRLELELLSNLSNFWQSYQNNLQVVLLEQQNLISARENYSIAMERYKLGNLPGIDMREAQKSLLDAEERILTAQYNTKLCEISLQQISGNATVYLNK